MEDPTAFAQRHNRARAFSGGWWAMESRLPGHPPGWHLIFDGHLPGWPQLFRTRRECRAWIEKHHGYLRERPDLQRMGFTMPRAVMVRIVKERP